MKSSTGTLFIVSTPIGNLDDFSPRAQETLRQADYILCESTKQTNILFIKKGSSLGEAKDDPLKKQGRLIRYEGKGFKGERQREKVIRDLKAGQNIALVSNSGTPLISDPGWSLVKAVVKVDLPVVHIPGPTAFVSAAVTSGLPVKNMVFIGYLPKKEARIQKVLSRAKSALEALEEPASLVFYVSKYQLDRTISSIKQVFGDQATLGVAREMTKLHEDHFTGSLSQTKEWFDETPQRRKGEFTYILTNTVK